LLLVFAVLCFAVFAIGDLYTTSNPTVVDPESPELAQVNPLLIYNYLYKRMC
jgi:hypothetical protein